LAVKILRLVYPASAVERAAASPYDTPKAPGRAVARRRILIALVASRMRSEHRAGATSPRRIGSAAHGLPS
jgi:hypothetical protein